MGFFQADVCVSLTQSSSQLGAQVKKRKGPYQRTDQEVVFFSFSLHTLLTPFVGLERVDINRSKREVVGG